MKVELSMEDYNMLNHNLKVISNQLQRIIELMEQKTND